MMMRRTIYYGVLLLTATTTVAQTEESDPPSDVPSYVPSYSPSLSSLPTIVQGGDDYDPCPICPAGQVIGNPSGVLPDSGGSTCEDQNKAGLDGTVAPADCTKYQTSGKTVCACGRLDPDVPPVPTASPVAALIDVTPSSRSEDCTKTTCTEVLTWGSLAEFVSEAASGDYLCMCGRFYDEELCATTETTVKVEGGKSISLECAAEEECSFKCLHPAMIVTDGSLTITGNQENFFISGGKSLSRVFVDEDGRFTASSILFEDTAVAASSTSESRHLQTANGKGGAIESYGTLTVEDCVFDNCTAALGGGAIYVGSGSASISGTTFRQNRAFEGGAIFVESGSLDVKGSTFEGNTATNTLSDGDIFARSAASVTACDNTGSFDDVCSGVGGQTLIWSLVAGIVAVTALFG